MITGGMLSAYVITWYGALQNAPATVVSSLLVGAAVITGVLTAATTGKSPSPAVVAGYLLVVAGVAAIALIATRPRRILDARRDPALA
jgi:drug/metabolite transporter (DMT)-like permease